MEKKFKDQNRKAKEIKGSQIIKYIISFILILYTCIALYLLLSTFLNSFKTKQDLVNNILGFPKEFILNNYSTILFDEGFLKYFKNSILLVSMGLFFLISCASLAAYGIAQYDFKRKAALQTYFMIGLMFPIQLGILPLFIILSKLHLNNTLLGLALVYAANLSFPLLVFTNFFKAIPVSVLESARIDGAGEFLIFAKIALPISKPVFFTMGIINFVAIWNDFYLPLVFLTKTNVRTLTLSIYSYMSNFLKNWSLIFAAVSVALIPIIIIYFIFSKQIVAGLTGGAVKE